MKPDLDDLQIMRPDAIRLADDEPARIEGRRHALFAGILIGSILLMGLAFAFAHPATGISARLETALYGERV